MEDAKFPRKNKMAPKVGLEPTTDRLTADCSTIELLWNPKSAWNLKLGNKHVKFRERVFTACPGAKYWN